jgi:hypothetical protein
MKKMDFFGNFVERESIPSVVNFIHMLHLGSYE